MHKFWCIVFYIIIVNNIKGYLQMVKNNLKSMEMLSKKNLDKYWKKCQEKYESIPTDIKFINSKNSLEFFFGKDLKNIKVKDLWNKYSVFIFRWIDKKDIVDWAKLHKECKVPIVEEYNEVKSVYKILDILDRFSDEDIIVSTTEINKFGHFNEMDMQIINYLCENNLLNKDVHNWTFIASKSNFTLKVCIAKVIYEMLCNSDYNTMAQEYLQKIYTFSCDTNYTVYNNLVLYLMQFVYCVWEQESSKNGLNSNNDYLPF